MPAHTLWTLAIGFLLGIFARSFLALSWPYIAFVAMLGAAAFLVFFLVRKKRILLVGIFLSAAALGTLRMEIARIERVPDLDAHLGNTVTIEGRLVNEPDVRESNVRLHIETDGTGILVIAPPHSDVRYGDIVRAEGELGLPEAFATDSGRTFNYPMYLAKDGIVYTLSFAHIEVIGNGFTNPLTNVALFVKHAYLEGLHAVLPEPESGLAAGITVGDKRGVGSELTDVFMAVGLVHILVLSGYNITIVMNLFAAALSRTRRSIQLCVSGLVVVLIVLVAGGAPSATRAGAMALLPLVARMTGRTYLALRALVFVASLMVLWNPYVLAYDPGFQLSVLATLGLILFSPMFDRWLSFIPSHFSLREIAASTLGTQLVVLPLLLFQNATFSIVSLPANLLALVAVPWAMAFSAASAVCGILFGSIGAIFAFPAYLLLAYILQIGEFFASLPFAQISIPSFSALWLPIVYGAIFGFYAYQKQRAVGEAHRSDAKPIR